MRPSRPRPTLASTGDEPSALLMAAPFGAVIAAYTLAYIFEMTVAWGLSSWQSLPPWYPIAAVTLVGVLAIPTINRHAARFTSLVIDSCAAVAGKLDRSAWVFILSLALLLMFWFFRSQALVYGDGFLISSAATQPLATPLVGDEMLKPLTIALFRVVDKIARLFTITDVQVWFSGLIAIGGVFGFWGIVRIAFQLSEEDRYRRTALIMVALSSGATLLFFGHIEHYTWGMAAFLWLVGSMIRYVRGSQSSTPMLLWGMLAAAFHALYLPMLLLAVLLSLRRKSDSHRVMLLGWTWQKFSLALVVLSIVGAITIQLAGWERVAVPVWPSESNPYWSLSLGHLSDFANVLLMVSPLGLVLLVASMLAGRPRSIPIDVGSQLLGIVATMTILISFWIEPVLGAPRDWDLLAIFGFPLSLFGANLAFTRLATSTRLSPLVPLSVVAAAVLLIPPVAENRDLHRAATKLDRLLWVDPHYQTSYDKASRAVSWGSILHRNAAEDSLAAKYFQRRIDADSKDDPSWFNLGEIHMSAHRYDSAAACFQAAVELAPFTPNYAVNLAVAMQKLGERDKVEHVMFEIESMSLTQAKVARLAGVIRAEYKQYESALRHFRIAFDLAPDEWEQWRNLGLTHARMGLLDSALFYLEPALAKSPAEEKQPLYGAVIAAKTITGDFRGASEALEWYRHEFPHAPDIEDLRSRIAFARMRQSPPPRSQ